VQRGAVVAGALRLPDQPAQPEKLGVRPLQQRGIGALRRRRVALPARRLGGEQQRDRGVAEQRRRARRVAPRFRCVGSGQRVEVPRSR